MIIQMVALNSKHRTNTKQRKHRETRKYFPKRIEEADVGKHVLNKIMTYTGLTHKTHFCSSLNITNYE